MGSVFGRVFRVTTFGESHGGGVGCVIEGCPAGLQLDLEGIQRDLDRRRPGQSDLYSPRQESDEVQVLSGLEGDVTLGTPICLIVMNKDAKPEAYEKIRTMYRPSHADYTYQAKYGIQASSGGGRASARETIGRVAAGAVARQLLARDLGVEVIAWVEQVSDCIVPAHALSEAQLSLADVAADDCRCPHPETAKAMRSLIESARDAGDSLGGAVRCLVRGVPAGLGEPVFDKLEALLAHACMSIPAVKGFEVGSGFSGITMRGSEHNDAFVPGESGEIRTRTNFSGGIQGGISNGESIRLRVGFKPTSTIFKEQDTVTRDGQPIRHAMTGRHDPCVVPRAVPVVEAMVALVLADVWLLQRAARGRL
jgi:chorismate synthase